MVKKIVRKTTLLVMEPRELILSGQEITQAFQLISEDEPPQSRALKKLSLEDWEALTCLLADLTAELERAHRENNVH